MRRADPLFAGDGEMARLMRAKDWSATPLGPPARWPRSLRTVVRIMLTSRFACWMGWGPQLHLFYNDAYRPTLGAKHAWALGAPADRVWAEIWPDIGPRIEPSCDRRGDLGRRAAALPRAQRLSRGDLPHVLVQPAARRRRRDSAACCASSPRRPSASSASGGSALLRDLARRLAATSPTREVSPPVERCLGGEQARLPVRARLSFRRRRRARRSCGATGIAAGHPAAPEASIVARRRRRPGRSPSVLAAARP